MKIIYIGAITTGLVVIAGLSIVMPALIVPHMPEPNSGILVFEIKDHSNLPSWCKELADNLESKGIPGAVFVSGKLASQHPDCIQAFGSNFDVGSQTYSYTSLPAISDYLKQLSEVQDGKQALDSAGDIDSKLFRAPNEITDENIYSLLHRSGIIADFSYDDQYNVYKDGQFIKHDLISTNDPNQLEDIEASTVLITFDNTQSIQEILRSIQEFEKHNVEFSKPSDLIGVELTEREA